jgi:hypothetical protein
MYSCCLLKWTHRSSKEFENFHQWKWWSALLMLIAKAKLKCRDYLGACNDLGYADKIWSRQSIFIFKVLFGTSWTFTEAIDSFSKKLALSSTLSTDYRSGSVNQGNTEWLIWKKLFFSANSLTLIYTRSVLFSRSRIWCEGATRLWE